MCVYVYVCKIYISTFDNIRYGIYEVYIRFKVKKVRLEALNKTNRVRKIDCHKILTKLFLLYMTNVNIS